MTLLQTSMTLCMLAGLQVSADIRSGLCPNGQYTLVLGCLRRSTPECGLALSEPILKTFGTKFWVLPDKSPHAKLTLSFSDTEESMFLHYSRKTGLQSLIIFCKIYGALDPG